MAIEFLTAGRLIVLEPADIAAADPEQPPTLLDAVRAARLPLAQSCRGEGVCRSCAVDVELGLTALPQPTRLEARFGFEGARRLACQVALADLAGERIRLHHAAWGRPPAPPGSPPTSGPGGGAGDRLEP